MLPWKVLLESVALNARGFRGRRGYETWNCLGSLLAKGEI